MEAVYSVSALTDLIRDTLERKLPFVWVRGEITNISRPVSGHIYFTVKDSRSQLQCVWFAGKQRGAGQNFNPLTGEVYDGPMPSLADALQNGLDALCAGSVSCYAARGQYQLVVEYVQPAGEGELAAAFEKLKSKLAAAGYFAPERKRPLPENPVRVALITSTHGAAIHDFLEISQGRGTGATIRLYPVPVQGSGAAGAITAAIALANAEAWAQVVVLLRGGGSLEDLWTFNEENVARAVFESRLPVLAGIGHEIDFTLADLTADVRAATPTHAAQILWPDRGELWQRLDELQLSLRQVMRRKIERGQREAESMANALAWLSPQRRLGRDSMALADLAARLKRGISQLAQAAEARYANAELLFGGAAKRALEKKAATLETLMARLSGLNPEAPLGRGYALLSDAAGLVTSIAQAAPGDEIHARLADGELILKVTGKKAYASVKQKRR